MSKKNKTETSRQTFVTRSPIMAPINFDSWWAVAQHKYKFQPYMKEVLYKHFQARGFFSTGSFDDGLVDFGIKG